MASRSMPNFQEIPPAVLRRIAADSIRMPRLYCHPVRFVRKFFWARLKLIHSNIFKTVQSKSVCIDFGCGSGVFLPSLCSMFEKVQGVDIEAFEAQHIADMYKLRNLRLLNIDIYTADAKTAEASDAIVAADVLEHFENLEVPIQRLYDWLKDDGYLFTSGPSENFFTWAGRKLGRMEKPWDHYHTGYAVEEFLETHGFERVSSRHVYKWMPMYIVTIWRKRTDWISCLNPNPNE